MKVVSSHQMAAIESQAYQNGSKEEDFMEQAGRGIATQIVSFAKKNNLPSHIYLLCGKGNNAGDAYVAGFYLLEKGYSVLAYQVAPIAHSTSLCQKNQHRFVNAGGQYQELNDVKSELAFPKRGIVVDALFGTGFHGTVREPYRTIIHLANHCSLPILAIDIPSGLNGDSGIVGGDAIMAEETIFLGLPKTGFFLSDGWDHVGKLSGVDFGLPSLYVEGSNCDLKMITPGWLDSMLPQVIRTRHKYQAGYVVGLGGSAGMPGAALLSSTAALRSGAGMVKLLHPMGMEAELVASPYELIKVPYNENDSGYVSSLLNDATAAFIGPGLGRECHPRELLRDVLPNLKIPCVIDADALTIIAEEEFPCPKNTILTPHVGEMTRLLKYPAEKPRSKEFLNSCQNFVEKHSVTLVLKGGPSYIFHPHETPLVSPYGNPGMATAGSGDVLTGIIASLLAQGAHTKEAAALGVYLHGVAGDCAAEKKTFFCLIATDIIDRLPEAFQSLNPSC